VVDHAVEYVRGEIHTNGLENFWSLVKRGLKGPYITAWNRSTCFGILMNKSSATTIAR
jgi:hypothetical protein